jgi:hypothetical protein
MFGRGNWAIVGLVKESLEAFSINLADPVRMAAASQLAAAAVARVYDGDAMGINPYDAPRLDEEQDLDLDQQAALARHAAVEQGTVPHEETTEPALPPEVLEGPGYARTAEAFRIHAELPWFGLWAVSNEQKKASDLPSIKEQQSYDMLERPYKFLQPTDKRTVDDKALDATAVSRTQVPVLLDFHQGRVYIESANKKQLQAVIASLNRLGAEIVPVAWHYPLPDWTESILNRLYERTQYRDEFNKRAEEAKRFKDSEIEKLEDRDMEAIVSKFFSMTELSNGISAGISGPARIRLTDVASPVAVRNAAMATTLLNLTDGTAIVTGALTLQESVTVTTKSGAERNIRRDIARLDVNDRINLTDVGAALLRGFDMASHKKDVLREIRETKQVPPIPQFWSGWLHQLSSAVRTLEESFREVLELAGDEQAGIVPMKLTDAVALTAKAPLSSAAAHS